MNILKYLFIPVALLQVPVSISMVGTKDMIVDNNTTTAFVENISDFNLETVEAFKTY